MTVIVMILVGRKKEENMKNETVNITKERYT